MDDTSRLEVTELLQAWSEGEQSAFEQLAPLVYRELHRLAKQYMARERQDHTLETTALLNEAYMKLVDIKTIKWQCRAHFFAVSAKVMRRVLVDYARERSYQKRGGGAHHVTLDEAAVLSPDRFADFVELNEALDRLASFDLRKSEVVELRFYGGLSVEETAEVLKVSPFTVLRDWRLAKAWLYREISGEEPVEP